MPPEVRTWRSDLFDHIITVARLPEEVETFESDAFDQEHFFKSAIVRFLNIRLIKLVELEMVLFLR